jgi:hypothetical protein
MRTFIAVDPGLMTGVAWYTDGKFYQAEVPYEQTGRYIKELIQMYHPEGAIDLVCEKFFYTQATMKKSRGDWSMKLIGVMEFLASEYECRFFLQSPAEAKNLMTDSRLRVLGWFNASKGGHQNDAARHLARHLLKERIIDGRNLVEA